MTGQSGHLEERNVLFFFIWSYSSSAMWSNMLFFLVLFLVLFPIFLLHSLLGLEGHPIEFLFSSSVIFYPFYILSSHERKIEGRWMDFFNLFLLRGAIPLFDFFYWFVLSALLCSYRQGSDTQFFHHQNYIFHTYSWKRFAVWIHLTPCISQCSVLANYYFFIDRFEDRNKNKCEKQNTTVRLHNLIVSCLTCRRDQSAALDIVLVGREFKFRKWHIHMPAEVLVLLKALWRHY